MIAPLRTLLESLTEATGAQMPPESPEGGVQFTVGENSSVVLFAESADTLLMISPVTSLPKAADYGTALWLLRRNFYDSPIAPFRVACDAAGSIVLWGRMPLDGLTGAQLAKLMDALATEADFIREQVAVEE